MTLPASAAPPAWLVYLRLGRVSNLPTVWSNCIAGAALALDAAPPAAIVWIAAAVSLFYTGGMFLNDAFDAEHDRIARPERPIPSGWIERNRVQGIGLLLLAGGEGLAAGMAPAGSRASVAIWGAALAALILYYSWRHKRDRFSAVVMAACRGVVYLIAATGVSAVNESVVQGALLLAGYVIMLSQIAKRDLLPGRVIALLIAGIAVVDAALIVAFTGEWTTALVAAIAFPATVAGQRFASGT